MPETKVCVVAATDHVPSARCLLGSWDEVGESVTDMVSGENDEGSLVSGGHHTEPAGLDVER